MRKGCGSTVLGVCSLVLGSPPPPPFPGSAQHAPERHHLYNALWMHGQESRFSRRSYRIGQAALRSAYGLAIGVQMVQVLSDEPGSIVGRGLGLRYGQVRPLSSMTLCSL